MQSFTDQLQRQVNIPFPPQRIISLVPSQTELLYDLGIGDRVTGLTKFCVHPDDWFRSKTRVGGTKTLDLDLIRSLHPDLIIANKEENEMQQVETLATEFPVWISDVRTLADAADMIRRVGSICDAQQKAEEIAQKIEAVFARIESKIPGTRAAYFIWWNPLMTVNCNTFIHDMMQCCGFVNVFADRLDSRYPEISEEDVLSARPEVVLLSSEPFPFNEKHATWFTGLLPDCQIIYVDGEMFSWYGSRLLKAADYLETIRNQVRLL